MRASVTHAVVALATLALSSQPAWSRELPRRPALGFDVSERVERGRPQLVIAAPPAGAPGRVGSVAPGDVVEALDGQAVRDQAALDAALRLMRPGQRVRVELLREGRPAIADIVLQSRPAETVTGGQVLYRQAAVASDLRRLIVTRPRAPGRRPAILLIAGLGCSSLEGLAADEAPYGRLLNALTAAGYVTMRVEKTGEGDSEGPPCASEKADFELEVAGYTAGLEALQGYEFVDPSRVFIFAHSIGPLDAALVAQNKSVRGIIAAETAGRAWFDYELGIVRSQPLDLGVPYDRVEIAARHNERCLHAFYVERKSSAELLKSDPFCKGILVPGVPDSYLHQVAGLNLAAAWKAIDVPVLVLYGAADPATSADESRYLVDMINSFHPGRASFLQVPGMAHLLNPEASKGAFLRDHGGPHPRLHEAVLPGVQGWLAAHGGLPTAAAPG